MIEPQRQERWTDPIVDEVREARRQVWAEAGENIDRLFELLRERQEQYPNLVVRDTTREATPQEPTPA